MQVAADTEILDTTMCETYPPPQGVELFGVRVELFAFPRLYLTPVDGTL